MREVFGEKNKESDYQIRKGVYAVIFNPERDKILTVRNGKAHYFLPGGGVEHNENHSTCLEREMVEETGYKLLIDRYIGNAMRYFISTQGEPLLSDGYFYLANLSDRVQEATEPDHFVEWINLEDAKQFLFHEHHFWAVNEVLGR